MRTLALSLFGMLVSVKVLATPLSLHSVVKVAIEAAHNDELGHFLAYVDVVSIQGQKDQPRSPQEVVQLLKSIDLKALKTDDPRGAHEPGVRIQVSMTSPVQMRFVVLCTGVPDGDPRYKIVEVYKVERGSNSQGGANGRQPVNSPTNRPSAAAAPRRSP